MKYLATALLLSAATVASAHPPLPNANWCSTGMTIAAGTFSFTEADIDAYVACVHAGNCPDPTAEDSQICGGRLKSCGNFDDDYGKTALMINAHCSQYANAVPATPGAPVALRGGATTNTVTPDAGTVVPVVDSMSLFNSPNHHLRYHKSSGIQGMCAKCAPAVIRGSEPQPQG